MKKKRKLNTFLILGLIMLIVSISYIIEVMMQPDNIWWTPVSMKLGLKEAKDRVEVYIDGVIIQDVIEDKHLWMAKGQNIQPVKADDIGIRLNNWHQIRAQQIPRMIYLSVFFTLGLVFTVIGVMLALDKMNFGKKGES